MNFWFYLIFLDISTLYKSATEYKEVDFTRNDSTVHLGPLVRRKKTSVSIRLVFWPHHVISRLIYRTCVAASTEAERLSKMHFKFWQRNSSELMNLFLFVLTRS